MNYRTIFFNYDSNGREELESLALGIWLGEGDKGERRVAVTNCDPLVLRVWLKFLLEICQVKVENLTLKLTLHNVSEDNIACVKDFWDNQLGLSIKKEIRTKKITTNNPANKQSNGTVAIIVNSKFLQRQIKHRTTELAENLM